MSIEDYARMVAPVAYPGDIFRYGFGPEHEFFPLRPPPPVATPPVTPPTAAPPPPAERSIGNVFYDERDSQTRIGDTGPGGHSANVGVTGVAGGSGRGGWEYTHPGNFSVLGNSYGTHIDEQGRVHDAWAFNPGALIGGIVGSAMAPGAWNLLAGTAGSMAGESLSPSYPVSTSPMEGNPYAVDLLNPITPEHRRRRDALSSNELEAIEIAMTQGPMGMVGNQYVRPGGYRAFTPTEAGMRRGSQQFGWTQPRGGMMTRDSGSSGGSPSVPPPAMTPQRTAVPGFNPQQFSQGQEGYEREMNNLGASGRAALDQELNRAIKESGLFGF